jgi:uncharacterized protein (TIGR03000 family)
VIYSQPTTTSTSHFEGEVVGYNNSVITMPTVGIVKIEPEEEEANIIIDVPAGAKLYIDGQLVNSENRKFHTPKLPKNKKFYYDLKAEMVVNGKPVTEERMIIVKAGDSINERFGALHTASK